MSKLLIADLMQASGVGFGTSGARGLVSDMTDKVCYAYTKGFLQYLQFKQVQGNNSRVGIAGDLRPSTKRILSAVMLAAKELAVEPVYCGLIPSPAIALYGIEQSIPTIMVTGSHIPDDRNGIKFNTALGEISKADENGIREQLVDIDDDLFDETGMFRQPSALPEIQQAAIDQYIRRYVDWFAANALIDMKIGVYQHSGVARDLLVSLLEKLGANVITLGRSEKFIPVDTEAIREEDVSLAKQWSMEHQLDAIVSTDGDADRPLISDEQGNWLRGDSAGVLCARFLGANHVVTPVSSNTSVDRSNWFETVIRTRIGSPYVIEGMQTLHAEGKQYIVGYEANGGLLIEDELAIENKTLSALPTRDAVIVILSLLVASKQQNITLSELAAQLPQRYTYSDRIKQIPTDKSRALLAGFDSGDTEIDKKSIAIFFNQQFGQVSILNRTDGLRITFDNGEIIHLRPSGNAPELRCYSEANSLERAALINQQAMHAVRQAVS